MGSIEEFRSFYAAFTVKGVGADDTRLIDAIASIEREHYLGPGPGSVFVGTAHTSTISDDPRVVYRDTVIALSVDRDCRAQLSTDAVDRCRRRCATSEGMMRLALHRTPRP